MVAETPPAVEHVAGRHCSDVGEKVAELRMPAEHQCDERIDADAKCGDDAAAHEEAEQLADDGSAFGRKGRKHGLSCPLTASN